MDFFLKSVLNLKERDPLCCVSAEVPSAEVPAAEVLSAELVNSIRGFLVRTMKILHLFLQKTVAFSFATQIYIKRLEA